MLNKSLSDPPWPRERYSAFGFEIKCGDDGIVGAGITESVGTAGSAGRGEDTQSC